MINDHDLPRIKKSSREIDVIRGKLLANSATREDVNEFLKYVRVLEFLVKEASLCDFYGTEGWRRRVGLD